MGFLLKRCWKVSVLLLGFVLFTSPAMAADVIVRIGESIFDDYANALGTLKKTGHFTFLCDSDYTIKVKDLEFNIKENEDVAVTGKFKVDWCGFHPEFELNADMRVFYDSNARAIKVRTTHACVEFCFGRVCLPPCISVKEQFSFDIPVRVALFSFGTAGGQHTLRLSAENVELKEKNGFIEVTGDVILW